MIFYQFLNESNSFLYLFYRILWMEVTEELKRVTARKTEVEKNGETAMYHMKNNKNISEKYLYKIHSLIICNMKWLLFSIVLNLFNILSDSICAHMILHNVKYSDLFWRNSCNTRILIRPVAKIFWGWTNLWKCNFSRMKS